MEMKIGDKIEYEVDLKKIITVFYRFKWMIIIMTLLGVIISAIIAYLKPNIYKATTTVEIQTKSWFNSNQQDTRAAALSGEMFMNLYTQMLIIKSRYLASRALKRVDFSHRYYVKSFLKERELYKKSPFDVNLTMGYGRSFYLYPIDSKKFKLETDIYQDGEKHKISQIYTYGQYISTPLYELTVNRNIDNKILYKRYRFVVLDPKKLPSMVVGNIQVNTIIRGSSMLGIGYKGLVPQRVRDFSIALANEYLAQNIERRTWEASQTVILIDKQLNNIKNKIERITRRIEKFRKDTQTINIDRKTERLSEKLNDFESKIIILKLQDDILHKFIQRVKNGDSIETITIAGIGLADGTFSQLLQKFRKLMTKRRDLIRNFTSTHPSIKKIDYQINMQRKIILEAMNNIYSTILEKEKFMKEQIYKINKELNRLPEIQRKYLTLQRDFKTSKRFYEYLLEKRTEAEIRKTSNMNLNRIIDGALIPSYAISPKRKMYILAGLFIGLILGVFIAFLRDILDDKIKSEDEVKSMTDIPMLGTIPHFYMNDKFKPIVEVDPKSIAAESFRSIRTNLNFMTPLNQGIVILVTSTIQGEGKTLITSNLASIISMSNKKVLLMSIDMRRPALHKMFGINSNTKGLSNILSGHSLLDEVIQKNLINNIDIILSGPKPPNPSELLGGEIFPIIIEELKDRYDIVIIDSPPVGPVSDTKLILKYVDIIGYVLRSGYSRKNFIYTMQEIYEEHNLHSMGFILNDFDIKKHGYGYNYKYGYSYATKYKYYYSDEEELNSFKKIIRIIKKKLKRDKKDKYHREK